VLSLLPRDRLNSMGRSLFWFWGFCADENIHMLSWPRRVNIPKSPIAVPHMTQKWPKRAQSVPQVPSSQLLSGTEWNNMGHIYRNPCQKGCAARRSYFSEADSLGRPVADTIRARLVGVGSKGRLGSSQAGYGHPVG
jgi:hypothetical protein